MRVLLSIKPQYADKIFNGSKRYEFRKSIFKNPTIKTVVVYSSSPTQKVIGEFSIDRILSHDIETLWAKTKRYAGIDEEFFYDYFSEKEIGYAIKVKEFKRYKKPLCLKTHFNVLPPQSFLYLD